MLDVSVIGCGIVGATVAYELSRNDISVAVFERENDVGMGATKANSAIIHAGYDPRPDSLMARLDVEGTKLAKEIFRKLDITHRECGALVLAFSDEEIFTLERLHKQGMENGVSDIGILTKEEILEREPNISDKVVAALDAPTAMIVDPWEYVIALAETAVCNGVALHLECDVTNIEEIDGGYRIYTNTGTYDTRTVVNAAGLYSDEVNNMVAEPTFTISPGKGEYHILDKSEGERVKSVIFQCPTKAGKGILVTPTVHGNLLVGPGNITAESKHDVSTTSDELSYIMETAKKSVPSINERAVIRSFSGNRAMAGKTDFIIEEVKIGFINLAGIQSPGLTAAPAIAKLAVQMLNDCGVKLSEKVNFIDSRQQRRFKELSPKERTDLVKKDPAFGRIICRCETVTEGEILEAFNSPIPPKSVDGVKRRCGAGMGRCQSGFCGPRVLELLANHYKCCPTEIPQDGKNTEILVSETKKSHFGKDEK